MTWQGSKITIAGFNEIFSEFDVSTPARDEELDIYTCSLHGTKIQAKTLTRLAVKTIKQITNQ